MKVKQKSKKIILKRFKITKRGKVLRGQAFHRHLNTKKSASRKRKLKKMIPTRKQMAKRIRKATGK